MQDLGNKYKTMTNIRFATLAVVDYKNIVTITFAKMKKSSIDIFAGLNIVTTVCMLGFKGDHSQYRRMLLPP